MKRTSIIAVLLALGLGSSALAKPLETFVASVQMPAWLERGGVKRPLAAGTSLDSNDIVSTGTGARLLLQLPEGSTVKLGENAVLRLDTLSNADGQSSPFKAALNVVTGAFRFTTGLLSKPRRREVDIQIATITAGIRGTDIWGKSNNEKDLVCLLEGKIQVKHPQAQPLEMTEPLTFYVADKGQAPKPVSGVPQDKLKEWAAETEIQAGNGAGSHEGRWRVILGRYSKQAEALSLYDQLRDGGYAVKIRTGHGKGKYSVQLTNLASEADAKAAGSHLQAAFMTPLAIVGR